MFIADNEVMFKRVNDLETRLKEVENDYKEAKESVDFVVSEQAILAEELKEAQDTLSRERAEWDKVRQERDQELIEARAQLEIKDETLQRLASKFARNRDVWLENEKKANEEIQKLDELIDRMVTAMSANTDVVRTWPEMKTLLEELSDVQAEKSFAV